MIATAFVTGGLAAPDSDARSRFDRPLEGKRAVTPPPRSASSDLGADGLAVGITEPNPNFIWPVKARPVPRPFEPWRAQLDAMRPAVYRLIVDWAALQPEADLPLELDERHNGCGRGAPPCAAYEGLREQLRALNAQQQARPDGHWQVLVVLAGTPAWAASDGGGCESPDVRTRSRAPRPDALEAYQRAIELIALLAIREDVDIRYWSPWNEPNHPFTVSPQRSACASGSTSVVRVPYVRLARAMTEVLDRLPGERRLVLGEAAGFTRPTARGTTVVELIRSLPEDVVCSSSIWAQHAYVGATDPVPIVLRELDRHGCATRHHVWVTETGARGPVRADGRRVTHARVRRSCAGLERRLHAWWRNQRVDVAMQYTLREDPLFPTGLISADLRRVRPTLALWRAWSQPRRAATPAPERGACRGFSQQRALPEQLALKPSFARAATAPAW